MSEIKSKRAKSLLLKPQAFGLHPQSEMRKYPSNEIDLWVYLEREQLNVKYLSFSGHLQEYERVLLEALAALIKDRPISMLENLTLRECEAYLRDRNSEYALENIPEGDELRFKKIFQWLRILPESKAPQEYHFPSEKTPFRDLKLVDKIRELKAFLNSYEVLELYKESSCPELIDVDGLSVYVQAPYATENERALFEELHLLGVSTFQEESLNFIPEA